MAEPIEISAPITLPPAIVITAPISLGSGGGASIIVSATPPVSPTLGAQWYDPEYRIMSVWDGTVWVGTEFLPITSAIPALAFLAPGGEPYLSPTGEYYLAPA